MIDEEEEEGMDEDPEDKNPQKRKQRKPERVTCFDKTSTPTTTTTTFDDNVTVMEDVDSNCLKLPMPIVNG